MSRWGRSRHWPEYVSVGEKRAKAANQIEKLRKKGKNVEPVVIEGRTIARTFWGKKWCSHFESFSDYQNRLPRGRTYARHGGICHLEIDTGKVRALVSGSSLYEIDVRITPLEDGRWAAIKKQCAGSIGSLIELLQGRMSDSVMEIITDPINGLFPQTGEIKYDCDCPDWAVMCKHVAAVFYGIGHRFDSFPELLFQLRGVDPTELIDSSVSFAAPETAADNDVIDDAELSGIFGIELEDTASSPEPDQPERQTRSKSPKKKSTKKKSAKTSGKASAKRTMKKKTTKKKTRKVTAKKPAGKSAAGKQEKQPPKSRKRKQFSSTPFKPTGQNILKLRKRLKMSRSQFAQTLGVTETSVYRWEKIKGKVGMHDKNVKRLRDLAQECRGK
ncbi:MAG: hypothetical protein ACOCVL_01050 [Candidatus Sumerlaeota bacterium]